MVGNWKNKDSPLIRTRKTKIPFNYRAEIKVGSAILIHVFTLTCMKVKLIDIRIMHKARI